jgi:hypothetical protein
LSIEKRERILKVAREKHLITNKGKSISITSDFSTETLKTRRTWNGVFQALKENSCLYRLPCQKAILHN